MPFSASAMALSHPLKLLLTFLSRLLTLLDMAGLTDYRKAYDTAKQELAEILETQRDIEKRMIVLRQSLATLAALCESEDLPIEESAQAAYILEHSTLGEEIRAILKAVWPGYLRPNQVKSELEKLGHDLGEYQNPQATIHMVLKRMAETGDVQEGTTPEGKKTYRSFIAAELQTPKSKWNPKESKW